MSNNWNIIIAFSLYFFDYLIKFTSDPNSRKTANNKSNIAKYGYLYNWQTAKKVCPTGWKLPSISEFETLLSNVEASENAYPELKEGGSTGFNALLGGRRYNDGSFNNIGSYGYWWSSSEYGNRHARSLSLGLSSSDQPVGVGIGHVELGYAVRCLKE